MSEEIRDKIENQVKDIDAGFTARITSKEQLKELPALTDYIAKHCIITPYSYLAQKCGNAVCCSELRSPMEMRYIV